MVNVDMIAWRGLGDTAVAEDYWSTGNNVPELDDDENLTLVSTEFSDDNSRVKFITRRRLDTGDALEDFLIPMNEEVDMVWAWRRNGGVWDLSAHD